MSSVFCMAALHALQVLNIQSFGYLCRCEVVTEEASSSEALLIAKLKPFPAISFDCTGGDVTVPSDRKLVCCSMQCRFPSTCSVLENPVSAQHYKIRIISLCAQVYDVLKPNKRFSKGNPDAPKLAVCLSTGSNIPSCSIVQHLHNVVAPLPLHFARVSGGEVSFHSLHSQH